MNADDRAVRRALRVALAGNLVVAVAKAAYGVATGTLAVLADAAHSFVDAGSSLIGLLSLRVARKPSDDDHHYGHEKFETLAALGVGGFVALSAWEVVKAAFARLTGGEPGFYHFSGPWIIVVTMAFNFLLSRYELKVARERDSRLLFADGMHTRSDVLVSAVVLVSLGGLAFGQPWLDPVVSLVIAGYLARTAFRIVRENVLDLTDAAFLDTDAIETVAREVPGVIDCHKVRTRGRAGAAFVDLHIQIAPETDTETSHRIVHEVDDRIMRRIPGVRDVLIHTEPYPDDRSRG